MHSVLVCYKDIWTQGLTFSPWRQFAQIPRISIHHAVANPRWHCHCECARLERNVVARDVSQLSRDVCNSLRDLTSILSGDESNLSRELSCSGSREAMRLSGDVFNSSRNVTLLSRNVILLRVKQCCYRAVSSRDVCSYRAMYAIHRAMSFISCTMWSSPILKQTAYHKY